MGYELPPGPWKTSESCGDLNSIVDVNGYPVIARSWVEGIEVDEAALPVILAAPELLEALVKLHYLFDPRDVTGGYEAYAAARAAIARATSAKGGGVMGVERTIRLVPEKSPDESIRRWQVDPSDPANGGADAILRAWGYPPRIWPEAIMGLVFQASELGVRLIFEPLPESARNAL